MHTRNDYHHIFQRRSTVFFRSVTSWRIKRGHSTPHPPPPLRSNHPAARLTAKLLQQHFNQHWRQLPPGNMVCRRHGSLVARDIDTFVPGRQTGSGARTLGALNGISTTYWPTYFTIRMRFFRIFEPPKNFWGHTPQLTLPPDHNPHLPHPASHIPHLPHHTRLYSSVRTPVHRTISCHTPAGVFIIR